MDADTPFYVPAKPIPGEPPPEPRGDEEGPELLPMPREVGA